MTTGDARVRLLRRAAPALLLVILAAWTSERNLAPGHLRDRDPTQHFIYAYNLAKHGTFSLDRRDAAPLRPDATRAPAFPALLSLGFFLFDAPADADLRCYLPGGSPARANASACRAHHRKIIRVNQAVYIVLVLVTYFVALDLAGGVVAASAAAAMAGAVLHPWVGVYRAEVLSALLLLVHAYGLLRLFRGRPRPLATAAVCGIAGGLLPLSQAASVFWTYLLPCFPLLAFWARRRGGRAPEPLALLVVAVLALGITGGWMLRNRVQTGVFGISSRGGAVMAVRAEFSTMTAEEYRAGWRLFHPFASRLTVHLKHIDSPGAERFARGNPDGFYRRVRYLIIPLYFPVQAEKERKSLARMAERHAGRGAVSSKLSTGLPESDAALRAAALEVMREHWRMHLALTPMMLSRGLRLQLPLLVLVLAVVAWRRDLGVLAFLGPALCSAALHSAVTHYIPRYGDPLAPVIATAFVWSVAEVVREIRTRTGGSFDIIAAAD